MLKNKDYLHFSHLATNVSATCLQRVFYFVPRIAS